MQAARAFMEQRSIIYCPECGKQTPVRKFCMHCGTALAELGVLPVEGEPAGKSGQGRGSSSPLSVDPSKGIAPPSTPSPAGEDITAEETLMVPKTLGSGHVINGRYQIVEVLGEGGMGTVYKAIDLTLNRIVAVKVTHRPDLKDRFLREAEIMANLNHPNIVTVYDRGEYKKNAFIVMEYIAGEPLENCFRTRGLSFSESLSILKGVALGLEYMHERGITHRDIKPGNIMLVDGGGVKIMDFGIAKDFGKSELTQHGSPLFGTPCYMSPEFLLGTPIDHRTDIYALGITAYKLFTGRLPFYQGDVRFQQINVAPPPPRKFNPAIPPRIEEIILKCLEKQPEDRYQSMAELRGDLDEALGLFSVNTARQSVRENEGSTGYSRHSRRITGSPPLSLPGGRGGGKRPGRVPPHPTGGVSPSPTRRDPGRVLRKPPNPSGGIPRPPNVSRPFETLTGSYPRVGQSLSLETGGETSRSARIIGVGAIVFLFLLLLGLVVMPRLRAIRYPEIPLQTKREGQTIRFKIEGKRLLGGRVPLVAEGLPEGAHFDPATGIFRWRTRAGDAGVYTLRFRPANLPAGATGMEKVVDVEVKPWQIAFYPVERQRVEEATELRIPIAIFPPTVEDVSINFLVENLPKGANFKKTGRFGGELSWIPTYGQAGRYKILVTATDGKRVRTTLPVEIEVVKRNRPPRFGVFKTRHEIEAGTPFSLEIPLTDPDGDEVTLLAGGLPKGARLEGKRLLWQPTAKDAGTHSIRIMARDGKNTITTELTLIVTRR